MADSEILANEVEVVSEPSKLDKDSLYITLKRQFILDQEHSNKWRTQAKEEFGFVAGDQWDPKDRAYLEQERRPVITFNRALSIIKAIAGIEINGRHETAYLPRSDQPGEIRTNEILTAASQWMSDGCDAEDEQSEAFQDTIICGMGWTEAMISYEEDDPDGEYIESKIDPLEMYWDRSARKKNLDDARRIYRVRKMAIDEARDLATSLGVSPVLDEDLDAGWAVGADTDDTTAVEDRRLRDENSIGLGEGTKDEVHIVQAQWWEREPFIRVADPITQDILSLSPEEFSQYKQIADAQGIEYKSVKQFRKVYKQAFLGREILGDVMTDPVGKQFSFCCITGERDRNAGTWFGLVRLMRDPQMWANKWLSQTLHILNTTAKGGVLAEKGAFEDQRQAQDTYAQPDAITWAAEGAISKGKIIPKPGAAMPNAYVNLLEFAISSIRDVTGINLELLGMRDANQPGILEAQRKQAAMTILATMFDSLRRFRKLNGRVRLFLIQNFLADGRIIRIIKDDGNMEGVKLLRDKTLGNYEVIIDDAPNSPNQKQETWQFLMQLMPVLRGVMTPEAAVVMLEYSPLPSKLVNSFKTMLEESQAPPPGAEEMQQLAMRKAAAETAKIEADVEKTEADAHKSKVDAIVQLIEASDTMDANLRSELGDILSATQPAT